MCGICGIVNTDFDNKVDRDNLVKMRDTMIHRGPDDEGLYLKDNVGLGFRRLSIIDLQYGHQPMCNEDGTIWITFNGEIYNHSELRKELISRGHSYKTKCDTESIIHLYEEYGIEGFKKMNGMFALAIWDNNEKKLILARDRLGIKPLYFTRTNEGLVFASEIKSILKYNRIKKELNSDVLSEYLLFRFPAGDKTMFKDIKNLLPGHAAVFQNGILETSILWDLIDCKNRLDFDESEILRQFEELLSDSVRLRLMSDVPLGTFCSGGVDSSLVSAHAQRLSRLNLNTFSVGFHEAEFDESYYAELVSKKYETVHHQMKIDNYMFAESLPRLIWHNDEPLNHANSVQIYHISKLAKQSVTVVLTGEGADELFGGYPRYLIARTCGQFYRMPNFFKTFMGRMAHLSSSHRIKKMSRFLPLPLTEILAFNSYFTEWELVKRILDVDFNLQTAINSRLSLLGDYNLKPDNLMEYLFKLELKTYLVSILNRQDKMSMAASIESRVPFLDHRLVEWGLSVPSGFKLKGVQTKYIVKKLSEKMLPNEVIYRKKSGFGVPISEWLRDKKGMGKYLDLVTEPRCKERGYWKPAEIDRLVTQHLSGDSDNGDILWEIINLELWSRIFLDEDPIDYAILS